MRTIAIVNQKGGCGKTTTAINLGGVLARAGQRTLLVDLDPQSHCAVGLGIPEDRIELQIGDALLAAATAPATTTAASRGGMATPGVAMQSRAVRPLTATTAGGMGGASPPVRSHTEPPAEDLELGPDSDSELGARNSELSPSHPSPFPRRIDDSRLLWSVARNLDLAPSTMKLAALEAARGGLADAEHRDQRLALFLARYIDRYDFCLIDCPPAIGLLTYNALRAADEVLIPVETSFFAMRGAERQVKTIKSLARRLGGQTPFRILPTMHDEASPLARDLLAQLQRSFADRLFPCVIRLDPRLKEAATLGQPLIALAEDSPGAADYTALGDILLGRAPTPARPAAAPHAADRSDSTVSRPPAHTLPDPDCRTPEHRAASEIQPKPAPRSSPGDADSGPSRAAELAARARQLLTRAAETRSRASGAASQEPPAAPGRSASPASTVHSQLFGARLVPVEDHAAAAALDRPDPRAARVYGARETSRGVLFIHPARSTSRIFIAGDFNDWSATAAPMRYNESLGVHEACLELPLGRCEYRLVVDGRWMSDPYNRNVTTNPFGEQNSVVIVTRRPSFTVVCEGAD